MAQLMAEPQTSELLLVTLNARYQHCSFGLRYLYANLEELQARAKIAEFTISESPRDIAEKILANRPRLVGFGVYIWNTTETHEVISIIKRVSPETLIVIGGPEVSFETEHQTICQTADYTIKGEAEFIFRDFCRSFLSGEHLPREKWISGELPDIRKISLPYSLYTDEDIRNRVIYVEASRGCPYKCEYCLSSLDKSVRNFDLEPFLSEMETLISRGARQFKFVDRTFNLSIPTSTRILTFFLDRIHLGLFIHFELVPDRLPSALRELIVKFPPGALQFEIGIQTWDAEVSKLISRRQDLNKITENFGFLRASTGVHTHADLIVGLPNETLDSFGKGFDALAALQPDEIQVGILKRLKGTPITRHDHEWGMVYQERPPFQILKTKTMDFETIQEMGRFAKFWDLVANSGNFTSTMALLRTVAAQQEEFSGSLFWLFRSFSGFLRNRHPHGHSIALVKLVESTWLYMTESLSLDRSLVRTTLLQDYTGTVSRDVPRFLRDETSTASLTHSSATSSHLPERQRRHIGVLD